MKHVSPAGHWLLLLPFVLTGFFSAHAQGSDAGSGTTAPTVAAALALVNSDRGALLPRVATVSGIASPAAGLLVFQTGAPAGFYYNVGDAATPNWQLLATGTATVLTATNGLTKTGSAIGLGGTLTESTTLGLGNFPLGLTGGRVGIGTSSPRGLLEVVGSSLTIDQQNPTYNLSARVSGYWQSFTAGSSGTLDQVMTYDAVFDNVYTNPQVPCAALLTIYQGTGIGGPVVATQAYTMPSSNAPKTETTVTFEVPAMLVAGQVYTFSVGLVAPPTATKQILAFLCNNNCYAGGSNSLSGAYDAQFKTGRFTAGQGNPVAVFAATNTGVGIGTSTPTQKLEVAGMVYSSSGGFKFPDGTSQTTAATAGPGLSNTAANGLASIRLGGSALVAATDLPLAGNNLTFSGTGSVGIGTAAPAASAALEVSSLGKGLLPPRMTQAQRDLIGSPAAGLTLYNTSSKKLNVWNGTAWTESLTTTEQPTQPYQAVTFTYTGRPQTYTVPAGVYSLSVDATGASGGAGLNYQGTNVGPSGAGARVQATLAVTPGETLTLYVGGAGSQGPTGTLGMGGAGYNGGGNASVNGSNRGGGGGGASDVRRSALAPSTGLAERLLVAGGGGGGSNGGNNSYGGGAGGVGGAPNGSTGGLGTVANPTTLSRSDVPGTGATQSGGGSLNGTLGQGGDATVYSGGGGGGGYYGGGGSSFYGGGGGGSSWVTPTGSSGITMTAGYQTGNGVITITPPALVYAAPVLDGRNIINLPSAWEVSGPDAYRSSGNVGIGTSTPRGRLDVSGGDSYLVADPNNSNTQSVFLPGHLFLAPYGGGNMAYIQGRVPAPTASTNLGLRFRTTSAGALLDALTLNPNGNVGIGTTSPSQTLDVAGSATFSSASAAPYFMASTAGDPNGVLTLQVPATNSACPGCSEFMLFSKAGTGNIGSISASLSTNSVTYNTTSDKRLKENITPTHFGLRDLMRVEVKDYNFIGTPAANRTTGFLAQDLFTIYPAAVQEGDRNAAVTTKWAVDYGRITPLLVQAIQDQQHEIETLKAQNVALASKAAALEARATTADADHASLLTLQAQMTRLLGETVPAGTQACK